MPAHLGLLLYGDFNDVSHLRSIVSRAGKVLLHERPKLNFDFQEHWRFASEAGLFWSIVFEIAWSKEHPLLAADKRLFVKSANCSYPYDIEAIRRMRSSRFGDFNGALPERWEPELPDAWFSTIEEGIAACCDVWASLISPRNTDSIAVKPSHSVQTTTESVSSTFKSTAVQQSPEPPPPSDKQQIAMSKRFHVAVSFPGAIRTRVQAIVGLLEPAVQKHRILYDNYHQVELAVRNLDVILPNLYRNESQLIVVFACAEYLEREWCGLEWRAIREMLKKGHNDYRVLRLNLDDTELPGDYSIDGFITIHNKSDRETADFVLQRLLYLLDRPEVS